MITVEQKYIFIKKASELSSFVLSVISLSHSWGKESHGWGIVFVIVSCTLPIHLFSVICRTRDNDFHISLVPNRLSDSPNHILSKE